MSKNYQWKTDSEIISGGYAGEEIGVIGGSTSWVTTDVMSGSTSAQCYYRDSNSSDNNNSSRVVIDVSETWTASIDSRNYLTININTTVNSIVRDDIRGNPLIGGTVGRDLYLRRDRSGSWAWSVTNDPINTAHTILGSPLALGSYSFTLAPGENLSRGSIYFRNNASGHGGDVPPSMYVDEMWVGTIFRNILPKDYRPGAALDTNTSVWKSHNRTNGACHVLSNTGSMTWTECRTADGGIGQGNPPLILHAADANSWYNQQKLGRE